MYICTHVCLRVCIRLVHAHTRGPCQGLAHTDSGGRVRVHACTHARTQTPARIPLPLSVYVCMSFWPGGALVTWRISARAQCRVYVHVYVYMRLARLACVCACQQAVVGMCRCVPLSLLTVVKDSATRSLMCSHQFASGGNKCFAHTHGRTPTSLFPPDVFASGGNQCFRAGGG